MQVSLLPDRGSSHQAEVGSLIGSWCRPVKTAAKVSIPKKEEDDGKNNI